MSSDIYFNVTSWFPGNVCVKPRFDTKWGGWGVRSSTNSIHWYEKICQYLGGRGHLATLPPTPTALLDYSKMLIDSTSSFFPSIQFSSTNSPGSKFSTKNYIVNTYMNLFFASSLWFDAIRATYIGGKNYNDVFSYFIKLFFIEHFSFSNPIL